MNRFRHLPIAAIGLSLLAVVMLSLTIRIRPGQIGVCNAQWTSGLIEQDFGPGFHWDVGPFHTWNVFDTTVQTIHMNRDDDGQDDDGDVEPALTVNSSDGARVTLDVSIKYQIKQGQVWKVLKQFGAADRYKLTVRNEAKRILTNQLGSLHTEEFYDPSVRHRVAAAMEGELKQQLEPIHVDLVAILIRDLEFDKEFEQRIKDKVLAQQDRELNIAKTKAAEAKGKTQKIEADTEAEVVVINQERDKLVTELRAANEKAIAEKRALYQKIVTETKAKADLVAAELQAKAMRLEREAEAEAQRLRREALSTAGGATYVALEMVKNLNFGALSVSTQQLDPLDIDAMLARLGAKQ